jgi:hypothetical protein
MSLYGIVNNYKAYPYNYYRSNYKDGYLLIDDFKTTDYEQILVDISDSHRTNFVIESMTHY